MALLSSLKLWLFPVVVILLIAAAGAGYLLRGAPEAPEPPKPPEDPIDYFAWAAALGAAQADVDFEQGVLRLYTEPWHTGQDPFCKDATPPEGLVVQGFKWQIDQTTPLGIKRDKFFDEFVKAYNARICEHLRKPADQQPGS